MDLVQVVCIWDHWLEMCSVLCNHGVVIGRDTSFLSTSPVSFPEVDGSFWLPSLKLNPHNCHTWFWSTDMSGTWGSSIAMSIPASPISISHCCKWRSMQKLDMNHLYPSKGESQCHMTSSSNLRELTTQITWHFTLKFHPEGDKFSYDDFSLHLSKTHQSVYYFQHRGSN